MRIIFVVLFSTIVLSVKAQNILPVSSLNYLQQRSVAGSNLFIDSTPAKRWFVSKYVGISSSFSVFNGGTATVLSAPIGLQLNRRLSNNWYAFAGVSIAPAYINFNQSFLNSNSTKFSTSNGFLQSNRIDMYSRAEMGLMYINNQKTFSISASVSVEKSSYPLMPINQMNTTRPTALFR